MKINNKLWDELEELAEGFEPEPEVKTVTLGSINFSDVTNIWQRWDDPEYNFTFTCGDPNTNRSTNIYATSSNTRAGSWNTSFTGGFSIDDPYAYIRLSSDDQPTCDMRIVDDRLRATDANIEVSAAEIARSFEETAYERAATSGDSLRHLFDVFNTEMTGTFSF